MAIRRCGWCGKALGVAPEIPGEETTGVCEGCGARLEAEGALAHAIVVLDAARAELERARVAIWPPPSSGLE